MCQPRDGQMKLKSEINQLLAEEQSTTGERY